jgi:hypothetical protein
MRRNIRRHHEAGERDLAQPVSRDEASKVGKPLTTERSTSATTLVIMIIAMPKRRRTSGSNARTRFSLGTLKGKCALGPFLSILVIECQHKWTYVNLCKVMDKVQIK